MPARLGFPVVALACTGASALLVALSVGTHYAAHRLQVADPGSAVLPALAWFDVNSERNVPTAWSALVLLAAAVAAALLGLRPGGASTGWSLVAATSAFLALDESVELHERLGPAGAALVGDALHFTWVVPGALAGAAVGVLLLLRLRRQPLQVRRRLVLAGVVYLTGALLVETLSGLVLRYDGPREPYIVVTAVEELLEMAGASLLLATLLTVDGSRAPSGGTRTPAGSAEHGRSGGRRTGRQLAKGPVA